MRGSLPFVLLGLLGVTLSGCLGGGESSAPPSATGPGTIDDGGGGLVGMVIDDEGLPVADVVVAARSPAMERTTVTDEAGRFSLLNLAPGDYQVFFQKLGYASLGHRVTVSEGDPLDLQVVLEILPVAEPWIESLPHTGYMETGIGFIRAATCRGCTTGETSYFLFGGFPTDYVGVVVEAQWESEDFLGFDLNARAEGDSCMWYRTRSESPVHYFVERCGDYTGSPTFGRMPMPCEDEEIEDLQGTGETAAHLETWYVGRFQDETHLLDPLCQQSYDTLPNYQQGCYGVGVAQDLRWETWVTFFHMELPDNPQGFSAFPDA